MTTLPIGFLGLAAVLAGALFGADLRLFLNWHAIGLVIGGTFFVLFFSSSWSDLRGLTGAFLDLFRSPASLSRLNTALIGLARDRRSTTREHVLITRALSIWEQGVDEDLFEVLLQQKLQEENAATEQAVNTLRSLAKYPPALGMTGTVMGLVTMFSRLAPNAQANLGASLALAMTATFHGLVLANGVLLPLADRLSAVHLRRTNLNEHVFRTLVLINRGEGAPVVAENLNAA